MIKRKRGSVIVEATIFFPIFFAAILTIALFMRVMSIQETSMHVLSDQARSFSVIPSRLLFMGETENRIQKAWKLDLQSVKMSSLRTGISKNGITDLTKANMNCRIKLQLPISFLEEIETQDHVVFRQFTGREEKSQAMSFEDMENEGEDTVWVFPRAGERYHKKRCSIIAVEPVERLLSDRIRKTFKPCPLCKPEDLPNGSAVYCFPRSGHSYHREKCSSVSRYVVEMTREEAESAGYTPCLRCGG